MIWLIVLGSILIYFVIGLFVARPVYVQVYRDWEAEKIKRGPHRRAPDNEAPLAAIIISTVWPLWLVFSLASEFLQAPIKKEENVKAKRAEQIKFWTEMSKDPKHTEAERETAKAVLAALNGG